MSDRSRDDLEQARARWWATVSTGDLEGYLSLFADDAVWVTPELDEIVGREAIREWLAPVFAQFDYELTITVADVRVAGDLGIERARFLSRMTPKVRSTRPDPAVAGGEALGGAEGVGDLFEADRAPDDATEGVGGVPAGGVQADMGGGGDLNEGAGELVDGAGDEGADERDDGALQVLEDEVAGAAAERAAGDAAGGDRAVDAAPVEDGRTGIPVEHEGEVAAVTEPEPLVSGEPWGDTAPGSGGAAEPLGPADLGAPAVIAEAEPSRDVGGGVGVGGEGTAEPAGAGDEPGSSGASAQDAAGAEPPLDGEAAHQEGDGHDEAVTDGAPDTEIPAGDESSPLPRGPEEGDHEPHEGRYLMYWRWHGDAGWLVQRYADVTGVG